MKTKEERKTAVKPDIDNDSKPVGYGSSIQTDGHGNRTRPQPKEDVEAEKSGSEKDKI